MKRTLWLLLLLPAVLGAAWVWQKTRITQAEMETYPWLLEYRIELPLPETTPALQAMNAAFPVIWDDKRTTLSGPEDQPDLMQALAAEGVTFDHARMLYFEPSRYTEKPRFEKMRKLMPPLAAFAQKIHIEATLPEHLAFIELLRQAWPEGPNDDTGFSVKYSSEWRRIVKSAPVDSRLQIWEIVVWNVDEPGPLKPHYQTLIFYANILPDDWLGDQWIQTDFLKVNSQRLAVQLPLWSVTFILLALPTPLIYFLRRPLIRLIQNRLPRLAANLRTTA